MAKVFGAEDLLAIIGITAADWEVQDSGANDQEDYASTADKVGSTVAASETAHNDRTDLTINLKCKVPASVTAVTFNLGGAGTGTAPGTVVITQFTLRQIYNDNAMLSFTAHKHNDGVLDAVHQATPIAQAVTLTAGFGIAAVRLGGTLLDCQSAELVGSVQHKDRYSNTGKFLVGSSYGLRFEATEEYVDGGAEITVPSPWKQDSQEKKTVNEDFYTRSVKAHAYSLS
jgi:hypothetical protein